eukprot:Skav222392  [mRNA]  locus=scaffold4422:85949:86380:+ [translate_table: standard]
MAAPATYAPNTEAKAKSWLDQLKATFGAADAPMTDKVTETVTEAKAVLAGSGTVEPSCTERFQQAFGTCMSKVHDTTEMVVGTEPSPAEEVEEALRKAKAEGQAAASSASTEASKALESTKGAMQQGMDEAQKALKGVKIGGA